MGTFKKWVIGYEDDYDNDSCSEWWVITNGNIIFNCNCENHAKHLCEFLNRSKYEPKNA